MSANLIVPYTKAGRLNVIGVASPKRYSLLPDAATFEEQGIKLLADPAMQARLSTAGVELFAGSSADLVRLIRSDKVRFEQLAKSANIKAE